MISRCLTDLRRDARMALRLLGRRRGFATVALVTLALGIGAPTAIFSVVHAVLLQPLPYPQSERLVRFRIETRTPRGETRGFDAVPASTALEWARHSATLADIAVFNDQALTLATPDGPFRLSGSAVNPNLFAILGVPALVGDTFDPRTTDSRQVVLSRTTWLQYFGANPAIVGSTITLDELTYRVVGVMPADFRFPHGETAFWVPLVIGPDQGRGMLLPAVARLTPQAAVAAVVEEGRRVIGDAFGDQQATLIVRTVYDQLVGANQRVLWIVMAAVGLVSVIATTNIALLLLVRGATRQRELSIRLAIGAGRGQLMRQLLAESLTLAALGGVAGVLLAAGLIRLVVALAPPEIPRLDDVTLGLPVLIFAAALTAVATLAFGLLSAGRSVTVDLVRSLTSVAGAGESSLTSMASPRRRLHLLAAAELALTLVLLAGAGLLVRSLVARLLIDQGFDPRNALVLQISLPPLRYPTPADRQAFHARLLPELPQLPGVTAAGLAVTLPTQQGTGRFAFDPHGVPEPDPLTMQVAPVRTVSDGFFEAMGMRLLAGRTFRSDDHEGAEPVMVISESLARRHFPDGDAVGRLLYSGTGTRRVVGVVGDVRPAVPDLEQEPSAYLTMRQHQGDFRWFAGMNIVIRGSRPEQFESPLRALLLSLDDRLPPFNVRPLNRDVARLVAAPRFAATVLVAFAVVAIVLAAVGVYGVMAFGAAHRTREIAVRMALGATAAQVRRLVLGDGVRVVCGGLAIGLPTAAWTARGFTGLLYDVQPADPLTLGLVAAGLSIVGLGAAYIPARRATRRLQVAALRAD